MQGYAGELEYKPGDHVGIIAANRKELVDALLTKVSSAPPHDQLVKVEILKEKTTVFGEIFYLTCNCFFSLLSNINEYRRIKAVDCGRKISNMFIAFSAY